MSDGGAVGDVECDEFVFKVVDVDGVVGHFFSCLTYHYLHNKNIKKKLSSKGRAYLFFLFYLFKP